MRDVNQHIGDINSKTILRIIFFVRSLSEIILIFRCSRMCSRRIWKTLQNDSVHILE